LLAETPRLAGKTNEKLGHVGNVKFAFAVMVTNTNDVNDAPMAFGKRAEDVTAVPVGLARVSPSVVGPSPAVVPGSDNVPP
jgi:hypothetical protein